MPREHPRVGGEDDRDCLPVAEMLGTPSRRRGGPLLFRRVGAALGNTPRRRGGRDRPGQLRLQERNTPASAGRTARPTPRRRAGSEHPRVGGEDAPALDAAPRRTGTPPRRRGGPRRPLDRDRLARDTPASAGRTMAGSGRTTPAPEHPRVGGEDVGILLLGTVVFETPLRRRGGPQPRLRHPDTARSTLRVGGEDIYRPPTPGMAPGTPLRRQGGHQDPRGRALRRRNTPASRGGRQSGGRTFTVSRNTPASAGRTRASAPTGSAAPEHPRVGGEDRADHRAAGRVNGTPRVGGEDNTITPRTVARIGAPPRRRGGSAAPEMAHPRPRSTPASAGRTGGSEGHRDDEPEHPRVGGEDHDALDPICLKVGAPSVGGEDCARAVTRGWWSGTPPRRRGGPQDTASKGGPVRNTPASAGRTGAPGVGA